VFSPYAFTTSQPVVAVQKMAQALFALSRALERGEDSAF
jgi:hypothetical protein